MREHTSWSTSLGRWCGVQVRVHLFFWLFAAFTCYLGWLYAHAAEPSTPLWIAPVSVLLLLASVLIHEAAHVHVARRLGGAADLVMVGPLGGLVAVKAPPQPQDELLAHSAGPVANLVAAVFCLPVLVASGADLLGLMHPLYPAAISEGGALVTSAKLLFWINWVLFLVNLLPAFPFDGGRALRAALQLRWPEMGRTHSAVVVSRIAKVAALALLVAAVFLGDPADRPLLPTWFALVMLALVLFFSAKQEEEVGEPRDEDDDLFGYDFSQGYTSLERSTQGSRQKSAGVMSRWLENRRAARRQRRRELEAEEERRVDEILSRLHTGGMASLSRDDRLLLERVSARYRSRTADDS